MSSGLLIRYNQLIVDLGTLQSQILIQAIIPGKYLICIFASKESFFQCYISALILTSRASFTFLVNSKLVSVVRLIYLPEFLT